MVFSNLLFIYVFLPLNIILYFCARTNRTRNMIMVAFSLVFYAWGEPVLVLLLLLTALTCEALAYFGWPSWIRLVPPGWLRAWLLGW